jgi:hypothetical protein
MSSTYDETILINLNSINAIQNNGTFLSDVYFNFKNIIKDVDDILEIQVSISNAQIPYSFYNVNVYNNKLSVDYNGTPYILTLTRGNYNATNLITEIQTQFINAGITGSIITISSITGTLSVSIGSGTLQILSTGSTIYKVLGLEIGTDYTAPFTAPFPLNLLGTLRLRICSYELITYNLDSTNMTSLNCLATIPIESATFGVILYDNITNIKTRLNNSQLDGFDILIFDDDNNLVNFNNVNWCISVLITITKQRIVKDKTNFYDYVKAFQLLQNQDTDTPETQEPDTQETDNQENQPTEQQAPDIQGNITDDNSLDLLLYNNGINPITGLLNP